MLSRSSWPNLSLLLLLVCTAGGCITTSLSDQWSDPDFSWDTLKRDQILMTPLLDLRTRKEPAFYDDARRVGYAEEFKQRFFKLRKDIRVFGAGGAFDHLAKLPNLDEIGRAAFSRTPLAQSDVDAIRAGNQDIRFILVLAVTDERLEHDIRYSFRKDQEFDVITYYSTRTLRVQTALWDTQENKTRWIGTKLAASSNDSSVSVANPSKQKIKRKTKDGKIVVEWTGYAMSVALASERQRNPGRFPNHPDRGGLFESTYDDFALGFPIHPSEEKLLEYSYFTYHRPAAAVGATAVGKAVTGQVELGSSSIINNRYRLGGFVTLYGAPTVRFEGGDYQINAFAVGMSADLEWRLTNRSRLMTGAYLGWIAFQIQDEEQAKLAADDPNDDVEVAGESDSAAAVWPRARLLFGDVKGFQWGPGVAYRWFGGIEAPVLKEHAPAPWAAELVAAYAFRGF